MTSVKTKKWLTTLAVSLIFIAFLLIWILIGENNALGYKWMIAHNGILWSGQITDSNYASLKALYPWLNIQTTDYGFYHIYNINSLIINLNIIWILLGTLGFFILTSLVMKTFKIVNWDFVSFVTTASLTCFLFFFINLIPHWKNGDLAYLICVLVLTVVTCLVIFFPLNGFFNQLIARSKTAFEYSKDIEREDKEIINSDTEISNMIKNKDEKDYIEI